MNLGFVKGGFSSIKSSKFIFDTGYPPVIDMNPVSFGSDIISDAIAICLSDLLLFRLTPYLTSCAPYDRPFLYSYLLRAQ